MLYDGTATGKGLNVKGKSAVTGPLSGFVPFLQISEEAHKALVTLSPPDARTRIFYRSADLRERARATLCAVAREMEESARDAARQLSEVRAGKGAGEVDTAHAAARATTWTCSDYCLLYTSPSPRDS